MSKPKSPLAVAPEAMTRSAQSNAEPHMPIARAQHDRMANAIRALAMDAVEKAKSGHPGLPMGMADVATVLFTRFLKFDAADPAWPDRDRFVLSAGHGSMLLYALLYLLGYEQMTIDEIKRFRQLGSHTPGHPEHSPGIETTTGPLGQGLANAVGMAIAERHLAAEFGDDLVDHRTYVLASDGDLMEGISHEAISIAGHLKLHKLTVLYDDNHISIDGPTALSEFTDQVKRFEAAGWSAARIDGHDPEAIARAIENAAAPAGPASSPAARSSGLVRPRRPELKRPMALHWARRRSKAHGKSSTGQTLRSNSGRYPGHVAHGWPRGTIAAPGLAEAPHIVAFGPARGIRAAHSWRTAERTNGASGALDKGETRSGAEGYGNAQFVRAGARGAHDRGA